MFPRPALGPAGARPPGLPRLPQVHHGQLPHLPRARRRSTRSARRSCYGMNLGCRTAVIFSPWDLSCGWDEHTHEHGNRLLPGDAIRLGINLVSYVAALRQVAEVAVGDARDQPTRTDRPRQQFVLAQLRAPGRLEPRPQQHGAAAARRGQRVVAWRWPSTSSASTPRRRRSRTFPFLYMTGFRDPQLDATTRSAPCAGTCRRAASCSSTTAPATTPSTSTSATLVGRLFPDQKLDAGRQGPPAVQVVPHDHGGKDRQSGRAAADRAGGHHASRTAWCWSTRRTTWSRT